MQETWLRAICECVELDLQPDVLAAAGHRFLLGSSCRDRWYPIRPNVNEQYESKLDTLTITKVNRYCGDLIERLGYPRRD